MTKPPRKTTLAKILGGLYRPDSGLLWHDDATVSDLRTMRAGTAMVFPDFVQYRLSAAENIAFGSPSNPVDVVHLRLLAMGFTGNERSTRRAVARAKDAYKDGHRRSYKPWTPEPGLWLQLDWGEGPRIGGRRTQLFCAWLSWSRYRVVVPAWGQTLPTLVSCLDTTRTAYRRLRACPADLVPTTANLAAAYGSFAELADACFDWCERINSRVHRETKAVPSDRLAVELQHLRVLPAQPHLIALGEERLVNDDQTVRWGSVRQIAQADKRSHGRRLLPRRKA